MKFAKRLLIMFLLLVGLSFPGLFANAADGFRGTLDYHIVRVSDVTLSEVINLGIEPRRVWDYDEFKVLVLDESDFTRVRDSLLSYVEQSYMLNLGGQSFDPRLVSPDFPPGWGVVNSSGQDFYLVQFVGPTRDEWLEQLRTEEFEIVQYIYPFTYVVWGEANALDRIDEAEFVLWTGDFLPAYKVLPKWRGLPDLPYQVSVLLYRGANSDASVSGIEALGGILYGRSILNDTWEIAGFTLPGSRVQAAAQLPGVYSVQLESTDGGLRGEMSDQINVNNHDPNNLAYPGYPDWLAAAGVDGNGVIIANVDGGIQDTHPDLVNRLVPCAGQTCGGGASSSHGTHTAGIMAADGSSGILDPYGFLRGLGMAPGANLVEQVYSPWFTYPNGMLLLMTDSFNNGASLSGNSWGPSGSPQGYDDDTLQVDIGVRDADPNAPGNQPLSYILSIMNGYGGYQTQGTPDEAKNIFTIGSTKMQTSGGAQILDINDLSANTAHGPALDGRNIPHMVAPGCSVDSTVTGGSHGLMCGTSMASPHVSGAVALFIEYYRNLYAMDPSPALVKAAFLPVAHDLAGNLDADGVILGHPFDYKQGWGRMDTAAVVSPTMPVLYFDNPVVFDNSGEVWEQTFAAIDPSQPVRIMLVWTDAPGHGLGGSTPAWNNDLDLIVEVGGDTYLGNNFGGDGWSQPGGNADYMNNTEGVFLGPAAPQNFTIQVLASNINSDGIPNYGDDTDQDFALVCYNCFLGVDFSMSADPENLSICAPDPGVYDIALGAIGDFTDSVTLNALGQPDGTTVDFSLNPVTPPGSSLLTINNTISATVGSYAIDVIGVATTRTHTVTVGLEVFNSLPGQPELLAPADGSIGLPQSPTFSWTAATQGASYDLEIATDRQFSNVVVTVSDLMTTTHTITQALNINSIYFWRVKADNTCGSSYSPVYSFLTQAPAGACPAGTTAVTLFSDDLESGATGWTHGGDTDTWTLSGNRTHSGANAFFADDGPFMNDQWLVSPEITLPEAHMSYTLQFWNYQSIQDRSAGGCYDGAMVEVSTDGGVTWTQADPADLLSDPYDGEIVIGFGNPLEGHQAWCGDPQSWLNSIVVLDDYAGETVQLRFRMGTNGAIAHEGWYIDDVFVQSCQLSSALSPDSNIETLPGSSVTHTFTLFNHQAVQDVYTLDLQGGQWTTTLLSISPVTVTAGASTTVQVQVDVPTIFVNGLHGTDAFTLTAHPENIPIWTPTAVGVTRAVTNPAVEISPATQALTSTAESMVTYVFTVTNTGNYTDVFTLTVSGTWTATLPGGDSTGLLAAGQSAVISLTVVIPAEAPEESADTTTLTAVSTLDSLVSASANATTNVAELWFRVYLPHITR